MRLVTHDQVQSKIIQIRNQKVILDKDVAELYGVETRRINEAVKRNMEKFPEGYLLNIDKEEWKNLMSQFATSSSHGGDRKEPVAFTEKGLYMLATILKSPTAVKTTIAIIETFAQFKDLAQSVQKISDANRNR